MFKKIKPTITRARTITFPHCDPRVLHAPGECEFCDWHPDWQDLRIGWGIAFTGYEPDENELPDPATHARGDTLNKWHGNIALPFLGKIMPTSTAEHEAVIKANIAKSQTSVLGTK